MPLKLIIGPPNSGRTGVVLEGFRAAASRDPALVVPTVDDVERFEAELTREGDAVIGATVRNRPISSSAWSLANRSARRLAPPSAEPSGAGSRARLSPEPSSSCSLGLRAARDSRRPSRS